MQRRCPSQRTTKGSVTAQNHHGWLRECPWRNSSWSPHSIGDADAIKRALVHLFFTYGFCVTTSSGSWQSFKSFLKPHSVVLDNTFRAVSFTQWDAGVGEALLLPMSRGREPSGEPVWFTQCSVADTQKRWMKMQFPYPRSTIRHLHP